MSTHISPGRLAAIVLSACGVAAGASAATEVQEVPIFWDLKGGNAPVAIDVNAFDTQGGDRTLKSVSLEMSSSYNFGIWAENSEEFAIDTKDWFWEAALLMNFQVDDLFIPGVGATGFGPFSAALAANDGVPQQGEDYEFWGFNGVINGSANILPQDLDTFIGVGALEASFYPFASIGITPPPPLFGLDVFNHSHFATLTVTYDFNEVPAPAGALTLAMGGLVMARRRRA